MTCRCHGMSCSSVQRRPRVRLSTSTHLRHEAQTRARRVRVLRSAAEATAAGRAAAAAAAVVWRAHQAGVLQRLLLVLGQVQCGKGGV